MLLQIPPLLSYCPLKIYKAVGFPWKTHVRNVEGAAGAPPRGRACTPMISTYLMGSRATLLSSLPLHSLLFVPPTQGHTTQQKCLEWNGNRAVYPLGMMQANLPCRGSQSTEDKKDPSLGGVSSACPHCSRKDQHQSLPSASSLPAPNTFVVSFWRDRVAYDCEVTLLLQNNVLIKKSLVGLFPSSLASEAVNQGQSEWLTTLLHLFERTLSIMKVELYAWDTSGASLSD